MLSLPPTTLFCTLSLHDALPICGGGPAADRPGRHGVLGSVQPRRPPAGGGQRRRHGPAVERGQPAGDRKSTRLNSSHVSISYAVFCLKKKQTNHLRIRMIRN